MERLAVLTCVGGPYGDSTSSFKGTLRRDVTLDEFIDYLLKDRMGDWGIVDIRYRGGIIRRNYSHGEIDRRPRRWAAKRVNKHFSAHGGWSRMDYTITLED